VLASWPIASPARGEQHRRHLEAERLGGQGESSPCDVSGRGGGSPLGASALGAAAQPCPQPVSRLRQPDRQLPRHPEHQEEADDEREEADVFGKVALDEEADEDREALSDQETSDEDDKQTHGVAGSD